MNEQTDDNANLAPRRQGMAIASEIIGGISVFTCSFFIIGAISGLVLGIIALRRAKKQPEFYGGETEAKTGIAYSILSLIGVAIAICIWSDSIVSQQRARETAALREVQAIGTAQLQYAYSKGHGKYTDLHTLDKEGLIEEGLMGKGGYTFTSVPVEGGDEPMYDTTAKPTSTGIWGVGNRSFYSNETRIVYDAEGGTPPTATPQNRIPQNGGPLK